MNVWKLMSICGTSLGLIGGIMGSISSEKLQAIAIQEEVAKAIKNLNK